MSSLTRQSRLPTAASASRSRVASASRSASRPATLVAARSGLSRPSAAGLRSSASGTRLAAASGLSRSATVAGLNYNSEVERRVIAARTPLRFDARGSVQAGQYRGIQLNREEEQQFRGPRSLSQYQINHDPNPEVLRKQSAPVRYQQEVAVRHLRPPTPPPHGDLVVRERQAQIPAGPPVVLRQEGRRAQTPPPQIYREAPPRPPTRIPEQTVEVEGTPIPPPARRVVLEKLADQPAKPQNILIERWLPYKPQTRRVVFQRSCAAPPPNPRNLVIEWQPPCVQVEQVCKDLGVERADPEEYRRKYACELKQPHEIPNLCQGDACGLQRSASAAAGLQLVGDVDSLRRVDLEREGLADYRRYL